MERRPWRTADAAAVVDVDAVEEDFCGVDCGINNDDKDNEDNDNENDDGG